MWDALSATTLSHALQHDANARTRLARHIFFDNVTSRDASSFLNIPCRWCQPTQPTMRPAVRCCGRCCRACTGRSTMCCTWRSTTHMAWFRHPAPPLTPHSLHHQQARAGPAQPQRAHQAGAVGAGRRRAHGPRSDVIVPEHSTSRAGLEVVYVQAGTRKGKTIDTRSEPLARILAIQLRLLGLAT